MEKTWRLWQLADSAFPTGGFAHSAGLEAAHQQGEIQDLQGFERFLQDALRQAGQGALPLVSAAHDDPESWGELDRTCDAFLSGHVANRASRIQGRTFFATCQRSIGGPALKQMEERAKRERIFFHYAPVFGVALRALEVERELVQRLFLYTQLRGIMSAAVRLGILGPYQAQSVQWRFDRRLEQVLAECGKIRVSELAQTSPILEILQSHHDRLYSRLFQS